MYQFIHTESYARSAPKTAKTSNSGKAGKNINYVMAEAMRAEGAHPHIDAPEPPVVLFGEPLESIEPMAEEWASSVTDAAGRKLRKDGLCLLAGVISAPNDIPDKDWDKFKNESVAYLQKKYGDCLKSVIEHTDESHPHLHFYVIPELGEKFETVHEGRAASAKVKAAGGLKGEQNKAYKAGMREFQDEFYNAVGMQNGMARLGPAKRRLTREEWKLEQEQSKVLAVARERAISVDAKTDKIISSAEQKAGQIIEESGLIKSTAINEAANILQKAEQEQSKVLAIAHERAIAKTDKIISSAEQKAGQIIEESGLIKSTAINEAANILQKAESQSEDLTRVTLAKIDAIEEEAVKKGIEKGLNSVEQLGWFKRLKTVLFRVAAERDSLKNEVKELKAENSENAKKADNLLKRAKKYFKTAKKLEAKIKEIEPTAKSAERYKRENSDLKRENNELGQQLGSSRARVQHLEAAYLPAETAETANSNKIARKYENTHSNSAKRSSSSSSSGGSGGDVQLSESRARAKRYENEVEGLGL